MDQDPRNDRQGASRPGDQRAQRRSLLARWWAGVTGRGRRDADLLGSAGLLDAVVDNVPEGFVVVDTEGRMLLASAAASEILGLSPVDQTVMECARALDVRIDEQGTPCPDHALPAVRALRGEPADDIELFMPAMDDRPATWITCRGRPIRDESGVVRGAVVTFVDVTRRKRVEGALEEQQAAQQRRVRRQSALAEIELAVNEPSELITLIDRMVELAERHLPATRVGLVLSDDDIRRLVQQAAGADTARVARDVFPRDGGATRWIIEHRQALTVAEIEDDPFHAQPVAEGLDLQSYAGVPMLNEGWPLGVLYALDTVRREYTQEDLDFLDAVAQRAAAAIAKVRLYQEMCDLNRSLERQTARLREQERRFRTLADTAPVLIWMSGQDKQRTWFNRTWLEFTGRTMQQEAGRGWIEGVHPDDLQRCLSIYGTACDARNPFRMEYRIRRADGEYRWVLDIGIPREGDEGDFLGYIGSCVDITYRKQTQLELEAQVQEQLEKLRTADRLASIGTLAAGLGHDMNNVLFPLRCRLDALHWERVPTELVDLLRSVEQSVEYLQQLVGGLRLAALDDEDDEASGGSTDIETWWEQVQPLIAHTVADRAELEVSLEEDLPRVALAPHRLTQAVLNLVVNAADAMPGGGTVQVRAVHNRRMGEVDLTVRDEGVGMSPEVRERVLEPFFTTKPRRLSTGLGLALVRGVVVSCGGSIDIDSAPGAGTTVTLGLPLADEDDTSWAHPDPAVVSLEDPRTAAWVSGLLKSAGFEPHAATAPEGARVWITDAAPGRADEARRYLAGDARRRVIVIGSGNGEWEGSGALVVADVRRLDAIRSAIDTITGSVGEQFHEP